MVRGWRKDGKYVKRMVQRWCMDAAQGGKRRCKDGTRMAHGKRRGCYTDGKRDGTKMPEGQCQDGQTLFLRMVEGMVQA